MDELVCRSLTVSKLGHGTPQARIEEAFGRFGDVRLVVLDPSGSAARVDYWDIRAAQRARIGMKDHQLCGSEIEVQYAAPGSRLKERNTGTLYVRPITVDRSSTDPNTLQQYRDLFNRYGDVKKINTNRKRETEKFVEYNDLRAAEAALQGLNGVEFNGVKLEIHFANRSSKTPAREGLEAVAASNNSNSLYNPNIRKRGPVVWMQSRNEATVSVVTEKGVSDLSVGPSPRTFTGVVTDPLLVGGAIGLPLTDAGLESASNHLSSLPTSQSFYTATTIPGADSVTVSGADQSMLSSVPYKVIRSSVTPAALVESMEASLPLANPTIPGSTTGPPAGIFFCNYTDDGVLKATENTYGDTSRNDWKFGITGSRQVSSEDGAQNGFHCSSDILEDSDSRRVDSYLTKVTGSPRDSNVNGSSEALVYEAAALGSCGSSNSLDRCSGIAATTMSEAQSTNSATLAGYFAEEVKSVVGSSEPSTTGNASLQQMSVSVASRWAPGTKLQWHGSAGPTATLMASLLSSGSNNNPPG